VTRRVLVAALCGLAGCPASYGFRGQIVAATGPVDVLHIYARDGAPTAAQLVPVAGAKVTCQGCKDPIEVDAKGQFSVFLGSGDSAKRPLVLHVTAPNHQPIELEVPHPPYTSQAGMAWFVIVMKPVQ
jgi:hypothetical protein